MTTLTVEAYAALHNIIQPGEIVINQPATIFYGEAAVRGNVTAVKLYNDKSVRLVGITPEGTGHVAWFSPSPEQYGFVSVGGSTVAYI